MKDEGQVKKTPIRGGDICYIESHTSGEVLKIRNYSSVAFILLQWDKDLQLPKRATILVKDIGNHTYVTLRTKKQMKSFARYVAEQKLGRALKTDEEAHHKNHDPLDNRWANILVCPKDQHTQLHILNNTKEKDAYLELFKILVDRN